MRQFSFRQGYQTTGGNGFVFAGKLVPDRNNLFRPEIQNHYPYIEKHLRRQKRTNRMVIRNS